MLFFATKFTDWSTNAVQVHISKSIDTILVWFPRSPWEPIQERSAFRDAERLTHCIPMLEHGNEKQFLIPPHPGPLQQEGELKCYV